MTAITTHQMVRLQASCAGKFTSREERLEAISEIIGTEVRSFSDLTSIQGNELIRFFNSGITPINETWGRFDKHNTRHMTILSRCHTLGWVQEDNPNLVDLHRLGGWLKSKRSPVQKPLLEMDKQKELPKIIEALDSMIRKKFKV